MYYKHHLSPQPTLFELHSLRRYISLGIIISTTTYCISQVIPNIPQKKTWLCYKTEAKNSEKKIKDFIAKKMHIQNIFTSWKDFNRRNKRAVFPMKMFAFYNLLSYPELSPLPHYANNVMLMKLRWNLAWMVLQASGKYPVSARISAASQQ